MNNANRGFFVRITAACSGLLLASNAFAYIDPGTGTLIIQWLFGMAVASMAVLRIHWYRAKAFFSTKSRNTDIDVNADGEADDAGQD